MSQSVITLFYFSCWANIYSTVQIKYVKNQDYSLATNNVLLQTFPHPLQLNFFFIWFGLVFQDRVSLCCPGCPGPHSVDQADLKLRNLPASASRVLGLKVCATTPGNKKKNLIL